MFRAVLLAVGVGLAVFIDARQLYWFGLPWPAAVAIAAGLVVPVLAVFRAPLGVWQFTAAGLFACEIVFGVVLGPGYNDVAWPWPVVGMGVLGFALFVVASQNDRVTVVVVGVVTVLAVFAPAIVLAGTETFTVAVLSFLTVVALAWGDSVRERRLERRRGAVLAERARIARELHDVVAHHISMIAIQAEAAPHRPGDLPPAARQSFEQIRAASREALTELRGVLGLLRREDAAADRFPQPGLDDLPGLVEQARRGGISIRLSWRGTRFEPATVVAVSVYRLVQEALSNAARYAPESTVDVTVGFRPDRLTVRVADDGAANAAAPDRLGSGLGLVGMRERVRMLGGTVRVGPRAEGGFEVLAELPVQPRRSG